MLEKSLSNDNSTLSRDIRVLKKQQQLTFDRYEDYGTKETLARSELVKSVWRDTMASRKNSFVASGHSRGINFES